MNFQTQSSLLLSSFFSLLLSFLTSATSSSSKFCILDPTSFVDIPSSLHCIRLVIAFLLSVYCPPSPLFASPLPSLLVCMYLLTSTHNSDFMPRNNKMRQSCANNAIEAPTRRTEVGLRRPSAPTTMAGSVEFSYGLDVEVTASLIRLWFRDDEEQDLDLRFSSPSERGQPHSEQLHPFLGRSQTRRGCGKGNSGT